MTRRHSLTTIAVYWFAILAGLALYTVTRTDAVDLAGLWIGVVGGTALGQFLAARDLRLWFVAVILAAFVVLCGPFTPMHENGLLFWMAMIPATLCGWLSLSDRGSLFAFWFPVVVWMLSILDRGKGALAFTTSSASLLAGLAFMFIAFLYARETRRVGLWRTVAPTPIAPETTPVILKEVPRLQIGLAGWSLAVSSLAFGICAWLAPRLWKVEPLVPDLYATSTTARPAHDRPSVRCCRDIQQVETKRGRVKEYFDIGRGHDEDSEEESFEGECVVCGPDGLPIDASRYGRYDDGWAYDRGDGPYIATGPGYGDGYTPYRHGTPGSGGGYGDTGTPGDGYSSGNSYNPSYSSEGTPSPPPSYTPPSYTPEPPSYTPPTPPSYTPPSPSYAPPSPSYTPPPPSHTPPSWSDMPPTSDVPRAEIPRTDAPPTELPSPSTAATQPTLPAPSVANITGTQRAVVRTDDAPPVVSWLVLLLAGGLAFQLLALGMRPVRRLLTLRHLRRPFWNETVDQRISNWWHLVLVGLRDAGWRTTTGEAPRELARRLEIDGVERAAAILERARHGVGIDGADLTEMGEVSEQAYRASRERTTRFARLLGWFRRPLV